MESRIHVRGNWEILDFGFDELGLVRIEARCHLDNIGSARVMEKTGMRFEGVLRRHILAKGAFQDVKLYSIKMILQVNSKKAWITDNNVLPQHG
ncbi:GNAT family N-acetyltransferase [Paenibacillus sp. HGF5]|uniref:GNAT family N-acetyltransferase n=1 Tax=Paenibacillus sp. HGF5 TaxID=908341 RepID=UPI0034A0CF4A